MGSGAKHLIPSRNLSTSVTCRGSLSGLSKTGGLRVPIDSGYEDVYYLTFEDGQWRIRGDVDDAPRIMSFGTSPHSLF